MNTLLANIEASRGSATPRQAAALTRLIQAIGLEAYRQHKAALGIDRAKPITQLSKSEAWQLINAIVKSQEAGL